jgi:hypothetical protein
MVPVADIDRTAAAVDTAAGHSIPADIEVADIEPSVAVAAAAAVDRGRC